MKTLITLIVSAILIGQAFGQGQHVGSSSSSSSSSYGSRPNYRQQRDPQVVQTRVYSRQPVYQWVGTPGYVDEKTGKTVGSNRQQVLTGYNVTYRVVYDNGSEGYYTNFESN